MTTPTTLPETPAIEYLEKNELFKGLDRAALLDVARAGRRRSVRAGGYFFRQGDHAVAQYVLLEGSVKLTQITPEGHQVLLRVVGPGEVFAAIAVLEDTRYPVTAQAATPCRALAWDTASMLDLMSRYPELAINALRVMARRVQEFQDRYRELATERVEQRIARALTRLARQSGRRTEEGVLIDLTLTRQDIAEMTGTARFTISRTLAEWEQQGIVRVGRERIVITQPHGLVTITEDLPTGAGDEM
jgi:CRP/FNR family transcriptional regulator, nitrogen oxide reductase regulator